MATISVIILNMLFRIGVSQQLSMVFDPQTDDNRDIVVFVANAGSEWGARPEVIQKATQALIECVDALTTNDMVKGPIKIKASFDEFSLDLLVEYEGMALELCDERPNPHDLLENEDALARLAGYMIKQMADKARVVAIDNAWQLQVHFDH
jgi:NCS2 family nucleobase:cation symporter-2